MGFMSKVLPYIGMGASAFGQSGKQGGGIQEGQWGQSGQTAQDYTGVTDTDQTSRTDIDRTERGEQRVIEDPETAAFRRALIPQMSRITAGAEEPLYGEAEKAGFLGGLNDLTKDAMSSLRSNLAATGRLDSGGLGLGAENIEMGRLGEVAKFQQQLPFLNRQYRDQARTGAMTLSQGLIPLMRLGQTSIGRTTGGETTTSTGRQTSTGRTMGTSQQAGQSTGSQTGIGQPWWKNLMEGAGGMIGDWYANRNK